MKLSGLEILKRVESGDIVIKPFCRAQLGPNSYDLRLDDKLLVYDRVPKLNERTDVDMARMIWNEDRRCQEHHHISGQFLTNRLRGHIELESWIDVLDMREDNPTYHLTIPKEGLVLIPGRLYLGHTVEWTETHSCVPCIDGRSSIGRLGIMIHSTAGFGDVGYKGTWTLEMSVVEPIRVYPFVKFAQIHYETVEGDVIKYQSEKYQGEDAPRSSGIWRELQDGLPS